MKGSSISSRSFRRYRLRTEAGGSSEACSNEWVVSHALGNAFRIAASREKKEIDVVVLDILMLGMDGIAALKEIKRRFPLVEVIMLTGHGTTETAVEGMKLGAFDYLLKPADFEDLQTKLAGARKRKDEQEERIRAAEAKAIMRKSGGIF